MKIVIETIPHESQRYPTCGDWYTDPATGTLHIKVSEMSDWRHEVLVAIHELVEVSLCQHDNVSEAEVDAFDIAYEAVRQPGDVSEPGDDPAAPYKNQHCIATGIERIMASAMNVDWKTYEEEIEKLP